MRLKRGKANGGSTWRAAKECGMYPAEKELKKQGDKGEKQAVKDADGLWGSGENYLLARTQRPYACSWAAAGKYGAGGCFLTLWKCQEAESLWQPREEAFPKAEAFLCYTLNKPLDRNRKQSTVWCEAKEWMFLLKHLATKWEVIEGPVTSDGIKEEILRVSRWWHILKRL